MESDPDTSTRRPTPLLVVGINRSGTKWLASTLAAHSQVVGPLQSGKAELILDSNIFSALAHKFPDLTTYAEYRSFIEVWSATRLFALIGADKKALLSAQTWPPHCLDILRTAMDQFALRNEVSHWVLKGEPLNVRAALACWPDARVILIRRGFVDVLRSRLKLFADRNKPTSLVREAGLHALRERVMDRYTRRPHCVAISFEEFRDNQEQTLRYICDHIGVGFERAMLEFSKQSYVNTSFRDKAERRQVLSREQERLAVLALHALRSVPIGLLERVYNSIARRTVPPLPDNAFDAFGDDQ